MTNLKIDSPCPMRLNKMKKCGDDFFCGGCQKVVVDFRAMKQEELLRNINSNTCGIFNNSQLQGQQRMSRYRRLAFLGLTIMSFVGFNIKPLSAQTNTTKDTNSIQLETIEEKKDIQKKSESDNQIKKKDNKKQKPRRRKKTYRVMGCPSF